MCVRVDIIFHLGLEFSSLELITIGLALVSCFGLGVGIYGFALIFIFGFYNCQQIVKVLSTIVVGFVSNIIALGLSEIGLGHFYLYLS